MTDTLLDLEPGGDATGAWGLAGPEPTNLIVPWPGAAAPSMASLAERLAAAGCAVAHVEPLPAPAPEVREAAAFHPADGGAPLVAWTEPSRIDPAEARRLGLDAGRWVLGFETVLDPARPVDAYEHLLRWAHAAAPQTAALLDVNTTVWHDRAALAGGTVDLSSALWVVQSVAGATLAWLHTHGLHRCGRPELEMIGVPVAWADAAAGLLDLAAELVVDAPAPAPGATLALALELEVTLRPPGAIAAALPPGAPGGTGRRGPEHAVACAALVPSSGDDTWPRAAAEALARGTRPFHRATWATERRRAAAQATWSVLLDAVDAAAGGAPVDVLLQCATIHDDAPEHRWYVALGRDGDAVRIAPAETPDGPSTIAEAPTVTDWRVAVHGKAFGPARSAALAARLADPSGGTAPAGASAP